MVYPNPFLGDRLHDRLSLRKINSETQNQECVCVCVCGGGAGLFVSTASENLIFLPRVHRGKIMVKDGVNFLFRHFRVAKQFDTSSLTPVTF